MSLFQKTVITKYLQSQNTDNLNARWDLFRGHFHNPVIQENIRNSKEEQYQEGFLRDLFVNILGYQLNPTHNFNLTTEYKNVKDSKKADGAIIIDTKVTAIIELKGTNTTDLSKIEDQAFGYKNNQENCKYVITSNFEKLRFYVDNAIEHIEFNLFELTQEQFNLMYLILAYENLKNNIPKKLKDESLNEEDIITKKLYKDYSVFKSDLFQNLTLLNTDYDPLLLFQKSQKLLDRLLFLFFGEDRGLLPPNSVRQILAQWDKLQDLDEYVPLYNRYKKYFGYLNTGFKGKNHDVFAYNGGLFKDDEILDNIKIDDKILYDHTFRLSQYDFASEVDVNILGHIFENSLNQIDEVKAKLEGQQIDKSKSKRKKDGVFYTPKYITKYIVENTVGKLCEEKKVEFGIIEEEYFSDKKRQQKTNRNLLDRLDHYRDWLLQITVVDPACGSGAFLNEALNFLIKEHQYIDELEAKLRNVPIIFSYHSESILEHNLFGVDLNEESVEIAKLSLWLRTAEPNRKLNSLNDNIKCGNSLIDDPEVAGDKAFNWQEEFPQVFAKGGFDVVIGNPPYITFALGAGSKHNDIQTDYLKKHYHSANYKVSSYLIFIEKGLFILKNNGYISYIIPNTYYNNYYFKDFRLFLIENYRIEKLLNLKYKVFDDAEMGFTSIPIVKKEKSFGVTFISESNNIEEFLSEKYVAISQNEFKNYPDNKFLFGKDINIWNKSFVNTFDLSSKNFQFYNGIKTGNNAKFISGSKLTSQHEEIITGKDFQKYYVSETVPFVLYDPEQLWSNTNVKMYEVREKLIFRRTSDKLLAGFDNQGRFCQDTIHLLFSKTDECSNKYLLTILNSRFLNFLYRIIVPEIGKAFAEVKIVNLKKLPVKIISILSQKPFIEKADLMLSLNKDLHGISAKFQRTCERKFYNLNLNKKLQDWYKLSYADFIKELTKQKIKLTLSEEAEWEEYFDQEKSKALEIQAKIASTDNEIDQMVYELYGLTEDEILIVENKQ